jgi:Ser/Thr protein kinase RdoA (MazF antagonist)
VANQQKEWTPEIVEEVAISTLRQLGYGTLKLRLLRYGENLTYSADGIGLVVRVARPYLDPTAVTAELNCAMYMEELSFPAGRLVPELSQPFDTPVGRMTLWQKFDGREGNDCDHGALGTLLRRLHQVEQPGWLRPWLPLRKVRGRIDEIKRQGVVDSELVDSLEERLVTLSAEATALSQQPDFRTVFCHGDAHTGNMLIGDDRVVLVDWEDASAGPWEWDISEVLMTARRFALPSKQYAAFCDAYGQDVRLSEHADLVAHIRELTATSWLLQNAASSRKVLEEGRLRISTMRDSSDQRVWSVF